MGLFSRTKTQVGTQVQRVIEDNQLPNSLLGGITKNIFEPDSDGSQMVEYVMEELTNNMGVRASRMYNYGKSDYLYGLPESSYRSSLQAQEKVKEHLRTLEGSDVGVSYYRFGALNLLHYAQVLLAKDHGWKPETNDIASLTAQKGTQVALKDIQVYAKEITEVESLNGSTEMWGPAPSSYPLPGSSILASVTVLDEAKQVLTDASAPNDYAVVTYCFVEKYTDTVEGVAVPKERVITNTLTIQLTGLDMEEEYHQVRYTTSNGSVKYWVYRQDGGISTIDDVMAVTFKGDGAFFPWAYFRFDKKSAVDFPDSQEFQSSKKLVGFLNMDYETVARGINENPDIADVEQAMLMMAVPAGSTDALDQQYLFDFFDHIRTDTGSLGANAKSMAEGLIARALGTEQSQVSIVLQDRRFKMSLAFKNLAKRRVAGTIGKIDTYSSLIGNGLHKYRHQVTENVYEEVEVADLRMTYHVFGKYTTTGDEENKEILLIPIDVNIAKTYPLPVREKLYARSMHFIFNSRVVTKLKWYQTGIFKVIMIVVAVVVTVLTLGSTWQSIVAAIGAGATVGTVVTMVLVALLKYVVVSLALKLFVKIVGVRFAFIVALVAAVYGGYQMIKAGSVKGAPWAQELMEVSSGLTKAIGVDIQSQIEDLIGQQSEFERFVSEQTKLLDNAQALLMSDVALSPFVIFGESPDNFYQRTVHSGNIGVVGVEAISSYVDIALQLPKISDTLT